MIKLCIVIPAYNEEKRIGKTLDEYFKFFQNKKQKKEIKDFEIMIVLNGCKDNTLGVVQKYKCKELKILNFEQAGKGFAIIEGFKESLKENWELIGFVDADMSTPPNAFYGLVKHIKNYEGIIANRWDKRSIFNYSKFKKLRSFIYNFIVRSLFLLPHRDTQCGAKLFKRESIEKVLPKLGFSEWNFDVDLLFYLRREKARVKSIPTEWHDQAKTHISMITSPLKMLLSSIRLRLMHSRFKFIIRFYRKLPRKLQITHLIEKKF